MGIFAKRQGANRKSSRFSYSRFSYSKGLRFAVRSVRLILSTSLALPSPRFWVPFGDYQVFACFELLSFGAGVSNFWLRSASLCCVAKPRILWAAETYNFFIGEYRFSLRLKGQYEGIVRLRLGSVARCLLQATMRPGYWRYLPSDTQMALLEDSATQ